MEMNLADALDDVIDRFIEEGILSDILIKQRGEIRSMVLNYTLEKHEKFLREEGRDVINKLNDKLLADNRLEDLKRSLGDKEYQDLLIKEYGLDE